MTDSAGSALRIRGLEKRFSRFHLGPLDLDVPAGSVYGLIGPNGAGKTTTIDLVMRLGRPDAGVIEVLGRDHRRDEVEVKRRVGYVSPELSYLAWRRVGRALRFLRDFYPTWDDAYCAELLQRFGLGEGEKVASLSLGNRTRLAVVAALAHRPELLIMDEPTTGLDAVGTRRLYEEILSLMREEGRTVLISSHRLGDLERYADHIGMMVDGAMLLEGSATELIERYRIMDLRATNGADAMAPSVEKAPLSPMLAHLEMMPPGARVLSREPDRWRVLVDVGATDGRTPGGAELLSSSRVTLEELFVALVEADS